MGRTYPNEISRVLYYPGGDVGKECRAVALAIANEASKQAELTFGRHPGDQPRTGRLAKSYKVVVVGHSNTFRVFNDRKYAAAMEKGARPHDIKAKKTTLQFRDRNGRWRNVLIVKHPGSQAHNTLLNATRVVMRRRYGVG